MIIISQQWFPPPPILLNLFEKNEGRNFIRNLEKEIIKIGVEIQNFGPWSNYFENGKSYYESVGILEDKTFSADQMENNLIQITMKK